MEVSVSFTDGSEDKDPDIFLEEMYEAEDGGAYAGRAFMARDRLIVTGPVRVHYEKYPWIEKFEVDGLKAAPPKRTGIGTKNAKGFVRSINTIYARAYDDYRDYGGTADSDENFDAEGYFRHAAEHFLLMASESSANKLFVKFCGFIENMWREGDERMYHTAMEVILPMIYADDNASRIFTDNITDEFADYIEQY